MSTTTISLRVPNDLVGRIDRAAERNGETRNTYILSWLPVYYDGPVPGEARDTEKTGTAGPSNAR